MAREKCCRSFDWIILFITASHGEHKGSDFNLPFHYWTPMIVEVSLTNRCSEIGAVSNLEVSSFVFLVVTFIYGV